MPCLSICFQKVKPFRVKIILLDKQELIEEIDGRCSGQSLMDKVFEHLNLIETAYFGLRYQDSDNQTHWLDPDVGVWKQIKRLSPLNLYLGVKFYAADPCRLLEEITRYQFFLQLKLDVVQGRLPVTADLAIELAALALQSELGDHDAVRHSPGYVSEFRFVSSQSEEMEEEIEKWHQRLRGILPSQAEMSYLEKVKWLDMYGVDLHPVIGEDNIEYFLGLTPSGIIVLRNRGKVGNYFWPRISKINFKGRFFMLKVRDKNNDESTYGFETPSRQACKHLWKCCVEHHAFFRLVQVSPGFSGTGVFSLGPKFQTEKQAISQIQSVRRNPPQFSRHPSSRYTRRNGQNVSRLDEPDIATQVSNANATRNNPNGSLKLNRPLLKKTGEQRDAVFDVTREEASIAENSKDRSHHDTQQHRSTSSLPRNLNRLNNHLEFSSFDNQIDHGNMSLQWLETKGLYGKSRSSSHRRSSMSEHSQYNNNHGYSNSSRRHKTSTSSVQGRTQNAGYSDNESEASSWTSNAQPSQQLQYQRRLRNESGSESERSSKRMHRSRRKRQGSYKLVDSDQQWQAIQRQQSGGHISPVSSIGRASAPGGHRRSHEARRSGYVNSGAETEVDVAQSIASTSRRSKRRQRSRSRSPGTEARNRLPNELLQHLEFGLVEPNQENVKGEIPFTNVEIARPVRLRGYSHQPAYNYPKPRPPGHIRSPNEYMDTSHTKRIQVPPPPPPLPPPKTPTTSTNFESPRSLINPPSAVSAAMATPAIAPPMIYPQRVQTAQNGQSPRFPISNNYEVNSGKFAATSDIGLPIPNPSIQNRLHRTNTDFIPTPINGVHSKLGYHSNQRNPAINPKPMTNSMPWYVNSQGKEGEGHHEMSTEL